MADGAAVLEQPVIQEQPQGLSQEIKDLMEISLNGGQMPAKQEEPAAIIPEAQQAAAEAPVFSFDILKNQFGYEKPEDVSREITELRALKANPIPAELKFENEESKKYFEALQAGKVDEVVSYYQTQKQLDGLISKEVTKDTAAEIIKMGFLLENKDLTKEDIDHRFKRLYGVPKEPVQGLSEEEAEFEIRKEEWKDQVQSAEKDLIIDAKLAKPKLESAKTKLVFPNIESANPEFTEFLEQKKQLEESQKQMQQRDAETQEAYRSFTPKQIESIINFKDEANKIDFNFQFEPDAEGFTKAVDMVTDMDKFWGAYTNQDGTPNRKQFLEDVFFARNKDKVILAAISQGKNAAIKAMLPDNAGSGMNRHNPNLQEPTELDKQMRAAGVLK